MVGTIEINIEEVSPEYPDSVYVVLAYRDGEDQLPDINFAYECKEEAVEMGKETAQFEDVHVVVKELELWRKGEMISRFKDE